MTDEIISRVTGNLGHITLNRPKALNALTQDMCEAITACMVKWEADDAIGAVLIDECHHAASSTYRETIDLLEFDHLLGVTATPWRGATAVLAMPGRSNC